MNYNFYESKHYKLFILVPIALLLISLLFIPKIQYDSSLAGGITVQFSTTNAITTRGLTASMSSLIKGASASVSKVGAVYTASITIPENASIVIGDDKLLALYSEYSVYSNAEVGLVSAETGLKSDPLNSTLAVQKNSSQANVTASLLNMSNDLTAELDALSPFINSSSFMGFNRSDAAEMLAVGKNAYSNASSTYKSKIISEMQSVTPFTSYSYQEVTPTLGAFFLNHMITIIIAAFIIIAIAVFAIFRIPIPAIAVVFGAANDIIVALGAMGAFGIPMGLASVGGLLLLIGYAIDTEMLSSIRILKRSEDTVTNRAFSTMKTGTTMTFAAIISFATLFAIAYVFYIPTYIEIAGVALFGLIADIFTTWFGNTIMIVWYKLSRERR